MESLIDLGIAPEIIRNGKHIFLLSLPHIQVRFIRSNNYISGDEYCLAQQFGVPFYKHFFPQKFNNNCNFDYEGEVPDENYFFTFCDSTQKRQEKSEFVNFLKSANYKWNFKTELKKTIDYNLLLFTKSCLIFLRDCLNLQNLLLERKVQRFVHPFGLDLCTIAGFTFKLYKLFFLNNFPIFSIFNEFENNGKEISLQEAEWAAFFTHKNPELEYFSSLLHPLGQKYFAEAIPDLYSPISKEAKFYNGCFWHGHYENCRINPNANPSTINEVRQKTYLELNNEFFQKTNLLLQNHPEEIKSLKIYWECEYLQKRDSCPELKSFLTNHFKTRPLFRLNPRSAVRGAFCDNFAMRWVESENNNEDFLCLDINGMYSYCAIKYPYMIGPYKVLVGDLLNNIKFINGKYHYLNETNIMSGTMFVTILPPNTLFFPYLLYRLKNGTTVNSLCAACAELSQISNCNHTEKERAFSATYFISEINFAISLGYKVLAIHECHYYSKVDFILRDFVKKLNCLKIQNSDCLQNLSNADQEKYCEFLNSTMDLKEPFNLTPQNVCNNPSAKMLYKLIANSLFGKLSQKQDKTKTMFASTQSQLENIYFSHEIKQMFVLNENLCQVEILPRQVKQMPNRVTNCYLGGQLTAYARQLIYEHIQAISNVGKIFYTDCDSIYFSIPKNTNLDFIPISDSVGHFKHVFPGQITSFYSLGPKSYVISYRTKDKVIKSITKLKGICLTSHYSENEIDSTLFNIFMTDMLKNEITKLEIPQVRSKHQHKAIKTSYSLESISFSNQISKRRMIASNCKYLTTFPYGYKFFPL